MSKLFKNGELRVGLQLDKVDTMYHLGNNVAMWYHNGQQVFAKKSGSLSWEDYEQSNLLFCLDCDEGFDESALTWKDLISGNSIQLNSKCTASKTDEGILIETNSGAGITQFFNIEGYSANNYLSIEICAELIEQIKIEKSSRVFVHLFGASNNFSFAEIRNKQGDSVNLHDEYYISDYRYSFVNKSTVDVSGVVTSVCDFSRMAFNGTNLSTSSYSKEYIINQESWILVEGKVCIKSIRAYLGSISTETIAKNYAVDLARFGAK